MFKEVVDKMELQDIKREVLETSKKMSKMGLAAGTWGNISARVDKHYMIITPSGMDYDILKPEDMVLANIHDLSYVGKLRPSIEFPLHAEIYKARPEINAVMHTHSINASSIAAARKDIPPLLDDMVQIVGGSIRITEYALPASEQMVKNALKKLENRNAIILASHGPVCLGRNLDEALITSQIVEKASKVFIDTQAFGGPVCLTDEDVNHMRKFYLEKYGQK
jgi:L-fuculose-phosphate aldolase